MYIISVNRVVHGGLVKLYSLFSELTFAYATIMDLFESLKW